MGIIPKAAKAMATLKQRLIDRIWGLLHRQARNRAVDQFRRSLLLIADLEALESSMATRLKEIFDPDRLLILRLDTALGQFRVSFESGSEDAELAQLTFAQNGPLVRWFYVNQSCLRLHQDKGVVAYLAPEERHQLQSLGIDLAAPLLAQGHLVGILLLGNNARQHRFGPREAEFLERLTDQASLAFQNAILNQEQRDRLERLHRADRLAAMGKLAAGVAHEVRNPLTAIRSTMQYLSREFPIESSNHQLISQLVEEVDRIDGTIKDLLNLTRTDEFMPSMVDLVEIIEQVIHLVAIQARNEKVEIVKSFSERPIRLQADPNQIKQVLFNLILNALQAMPHGGRVRIDVSKLGFPALDQNHQLVHIQVIDNGPGIPDELQDKIFDPFFTTKQEGTGLGLAVCQGIVGRHGGEIEVKTQNGSGTRVSILLPQPGAVTPESSLRSG